MNSTPYPTQTVNVDGISITVPTEIPSNKRAEELRKLYQDHVHPLDPTRPKGPTSAQVPVAIADDVAEAMTFIGDIVDSRMDREGMALLYSEGYYAHGF